MSIWLTPKGKWYNWLKRFINRHMIYLGASLIAFAAALLHLGFQAYFPWDIPCLAKVLWVLCGIFFVFGLLLAIVGIVRDWREKRLKEKDAGLEHARKEAEIRYYNLESGLPGNYGIPDKFSKEKKSI